MALALRGWGERDFRLATPAFMAAIRVGLFAEALADELDDAERAAALSAEPGMTGKQRLAINRTRLAGAAQRDALLAALDLDEPMDEVA